MHRKGTVQSYVPEGAAFWNSIKVTTVAYGLQGADGMNCKHRKTLCDTEAGLHVQFLGTPC